MRRIWAQEAGWVDNWSGGLYTVTTGGTPKTYVQIAGIRSAQAKYQQIGASWGGPSENHECQSIAFANGLQAHLEVALLSTAQSCPGFR